MINQFPIGGQVDWLKMAEKGRVKKSSMENKLKKINRPPKVQKNMV